MQETRDMIYNIQGDIKVLNVRVSSLENNKKGTAEKTSYNSNTDYFAVLPNKPKILKTLTDE